MHPQPVPRRWPGATVVVAAPGPSLTQEICDRVWGHRAIAVQDAYRLMPWADVLYGCDRRWWEYHRGAIDFAGERWASVGSTTNDNEAIAEPYRLRLVEGRAGNTFSTDPRRIHYGSNSGFQAVNLAILFGAARIVLIGYDMRIVDGKRHFFGDHPRPLINTPTYRPFVEAFEHAARHLPPGVEIVNATPGSALTCFRSLSIDDALARSAADRDRPARELAPAF